MSAIQDIHSRAVRRSIWQLFTVPSRPKPVQKSPYDQGVARLFVWADHLAVAERHLEKGDIEKARKLASRCLDQVPDVDNKLLQVLRERAKKIIARLP